MFSLFLRKLPLLLKKVQGKGKRKKKKSLMIERETCLKHAKGIQIQKLKSFEQLMFVCSKSKKISLQSSVYIYSCWVHGFKFEIRRIPFAKEGEIYFEVLLIKKDGDNLKLAYAKKKSSSGIYLYRLSFHDSEGFSELEYSNYQIAGFVRRLINSAYKDLQLLAEKEQKQMIPTKLRNTYPICKKVTRKTLKKMVL